MSAAISRTVHQSTLDDANWVRWSLITIALGFIILFLCVPLALVIIQAFAKGFDAYLSALSQPDMQSGYASDITDRVDYCAIKYRFWCCGSMGNYAL